MNTRLLLVVLLALTLGAGLALAQEDAASSEFPFKGSVSGDRVNVRSGPGIKFDILKTVAIDTPVTVIGQDGDWYTIEIPEGIALYVHAKYVTYESEASFPFKATVNAAQLKVRPRPNTQQKEMGMLERGAEITVKSRDGEYFEIAAPAGIYAYISAKYVKHSDGSVAVNVGGNNDNTADTTDVSEPSAAGQWRTQFEAVDTRYMEEINKNPLEWNFDAIEADYKNIHAETKDTALQQMIQGRMVMIDLRRQLQVQQRAAEEAKLQKNNELQEVVKKYEDLQRAIKELEEANKEPEWVATGWVKSEGRYFGRPAAYRLEQGGQTVMFVEPATGSGINLSDYAFENVGVLGEVIERNGKQVVLVSEIQILNRR